MEEVIKTYHPFAIAVLGHAIAVFFALSARDRVNRFTNRRFGEHSHKSALALLCLSALLLYVCSILFSTQNSYVTYYQEVEFIYWGSLIVACVILVISFFTELKRRLGELGLKGVFIYAAASFLAAIVGALVLKNLGYVEEVTTAQICTGAGVCFTFGILVG